MRECIRCGDPVESDSFELVRVRDDERVQVHGSCFLESYPMRAHVEDNPKAWANGSQSLEEHVASLAETGNETYQR